MNCERCGKVIKGEPAEMSGYGPGSTILVCPDCMHAVQRVVRKYRRIVEADEAAHACAAHEGGGNEADV